MFLLDVKTFDKLMQTTKLNKRKALYRLNGVCPIVWVVRTKQCHFCRIFIRVFRSFFSDFLSFFLDLLFAITTCTRNQIRPTDGLNKALAHELFVVLHVSQSEYIGAFEFYRRDSNKRLELGHFAEVHIPTPLHIHGCLDMGEPRCGYVEEGWRFRKRYA